MAAYLQPLLVFFSTDIVSFLICGGGGMLCLISFFLGIERIYALYGGLIAGIGISIIFRVLLSDAPYNSQVVNFFGPGGTQFIVSTSIYFIIIFMVLGGIQGGVRIDRWNQKLAHFIGHIFLFFSYYFTLLTVLIALIESKYIFPNTTLFTKIATYSFYVQFQASEMYVGLQTHIPAIIVGSFLFLLYRFLFADLFHALLLGISHAILTWIAKRNGKSVAHEEIHETEYSDDLFNEHDHGHEDDHHDDHSGHDSGHHGGHH